MKPLKTTYLLSLVLLALIMSGCSGGRGPVKEMEFLPDFKFTRLNGYPVEKLNVELDEGKRFLLLYFSRAYLRG